VNHILTGHSFLLSLFFNMPRLSGPLCTKLVVMMAALGCVVVVMAMPDCEGKLGGFYYDLSPLAAQLNYREVSTTDLFGRNYYYNVCGTVNQPYCATNHDISPAVCQTLYNGSAADCGSRITANMSLIPAYGPDQGFQLTFTGGSDNRSTTISFFWCVLGPTHPAIG
jgi:hypothetical protein